MITLIIDGVSYTYPETDDEDWGDDATSWAEAATDLVAMLRSPALPAATAGKVRLGNTDSIEWRDSADTINVKLFVDTDEKLYYKKGADPAIDLTAAAGGNVTGPGVATDNAIARYDGGSGQLIQNSGVLISDVDDITGVNDITAGGNISAVDGDFSGAVDITGVLTVGGKTLTQLLPPVGTIIWFYDFNALVTFNTDIWQYCDGAVVADGSSPINGQTLPDLSNRYLVGFGTEGGGDIDSAAWATPAVGNASHEINLSHTHTGPSHTHSFVHTHEHSHTHTEGSLYAQIGAEAGGTNRITLLRDSNTFTGTDRWATGGIGMDGSNTASDYAVAIDGATSIPDDSTTDSQSTSTTGAGGTGATGSSLSATQSIQPRSIRARALIRKR